MEPWINQFVADEQKVVLRALAETVARPQCLFLEIGSWCGDSALILGKVAKDAGGKLLCVDWWKGSDASYLSWVAKNYDVFSIFWNRIKDAGLDEVVIPIRSNSETAGLFLRERTFDLIYLDSDHRYGPTSRDLARFAPLVREGGLFCGHDCEGKLADFEPVFLQAGKDKDAHESVHCGTVLAVGEFFPDYSIHHSLWSAQATGSPKKWGSVMLNYRDIRNQRQASIPAIGFIGTDKVYRYGKSVYSVPEQLSDLDIRDEAVRTHPEVAQADSVEALARDKCSSFRCLPVLFGEFKEFNLISLRGEEVVGVCQALGSVDLSDASDGQQEIWRQKGYLFSGDSFESVAQQISEAYPLLKLPAHLVEEGYRGFNILKWKGLFCAIDQAVGSIDLSQETEMSLQEFIADGRFVMGKGSTQEVKRSLDQILHESSLRQKESERIKLKWWYRLFTWRPGKRISKHPAGRAT